MHIGELWFEMMLSCLLSRWFMAQGGIQKNGTLPNENSPCVRIPPGDIERESRIRPLDVSLKGLPIFFRRVPCFTNLVRNAKKRKKRGELLIHVNPSNPCLLQVSSFFLFFPIPPGHHERVSFLCNLSSPLSGPLLFLLLRYP